MSGRESLQDVDPATFDHQAKRHERQALACRQIAAGYGVYRLAEGAA